MLLSLPCLGAWNSDKGPGSEPSEPAGTSCPQTHYPVMTLRLAVVPGAEYSNQPIACDVSVSVRMAANGFLLVMLLLSQLKDESSILAVFRSSQGDVK